MTVTGAWYVDYIVPNEYKGKTLTISYEKNGEGRFNLFRYINKKYVDIQIIPNGSTFTIPNDDYQYRFIIYGSFGTNSTTTFSNIQLEIGDTATEYEPYTYNDITIYINEPLREGDIIRAENRKILVERHMGEVVLDGSADEMWSRYKYSTWKRVTGFIINCMPKGWYSRKNIANSLKKQTNNLPSDEEGYANLDDGTALCIKINNFKLQTQDVAGFKQWLLENPVTVVYQLASPIIEEVEFANSKIMAECYKDSTVLFNSLILPTSTIRYTANVISTAQILSINDEQDQMIVDNATQIAIIQLTL